MGLLKIKSSAKSDVVVAYYDNIGFFYCRDLVIIPVSDNVSLLLEPNKDRSAIHTAVGNFGVKSKYSNREVRFVAVNSTSPNNRSLLGSILTLDGCIVS